MLSGAVLLLFIIKLSHAFVCVLKMVNSIHNFKFQKISTLSLSLSVITAYDWNSRVRDTVVGRSTFVPGYHFAILCVLCRVCVCV